MVRDKARIAQLRQVKSRVREKRRSKMLLDEIKEFNKKAIKHCNTSHEKASKINNSPSLASRHHTYILDIRMSE